MADPTSPEVAGPGVFEGIASLLDQSLLRPQESRSDEPRYLMLGTVHEFGLEQLVEHGEERATRERHAASFLEFAEAAEVGSIGCVASAVGGMSDQAGRLVVGPAHLVGQLTGPDRTDEDDLVALRRSSSGGSQPGRYRSTARPVSGFRGHRTPPAAGVGYDNLGVSRSPVSYAFGSWWTRRRAPVWAASCSIRSIERKEAALSTFHSGTRRWVRSSGA